MLIISTNVSIPYSEIEFHAIRAQGAGGQNVNKVSSAVHLRFNIGASSLPEVYKARLLSSKDSRINKEGIVVIKAQQYRTREKNRADALERLGALIQKNMVVKKTRKPAKVSRSYHKKRLEKKARIGQTKALRRKLY